jgi:hypothetical protein
MNMKKILLAGIAVGALASTGANAASLTAATISGVNLAPNAITGIIPAPYGLPGNLTGVGNAAQLGTTRAELATAFTVRADTATGFIPPLGNTAYEVTFKLTGTANPTYISRTVAADLGAYGNNNLTFIGFGGGTVQTTNMATLTSVSFGTCTISDVGINSGGVGQNTLAYRFKVAGTCDSANSINSVRIDSPFQIAAVGSVILTTTYTTPSLGANPVDAGPSVQTLVNAVANYTDIGIGANPFNGTTLAGFNAGLQLPTAWAAAPAITGNNTFTAYLATGPVDAIIGSVKGLYLPATGLGVQGLYSNMAAGAMPNLTASLAVTATTSPVFAAMRPGLTNVAGTTAGTVSPTTATVNSTNTVATLAVPAFAGTGAAILASNINVAVVANNNISVTTTQAYSGTLTVSPPTGNAIAAFTPVTANLETTTLQGFKIDAPWFGGSKAATPSLVRLSNSSSVATGTVTLVLNNPVLASGDTLTASTCSIAAGVPATGEFLIDTARVTTCFGNFIRGDLAITVQGAVQNLTAKMRVLSSNGSVSEQTLGNLTASTAVVN